MIIESIQLEHVGSFRQKATIGPLRIGINVLAAPNETGKSTFLRAAARALFDKHTCKDAEICALQPIGSDLTPRITVVFEFAGTKYRIEKRFLNHPSSQFSEWRGNDWQLMADGDAADARVQALLRAGVPGRGATKAAHWGMLGFLWARQGETTEWPAWDGENGQIIKTRLARVEIDPVIKQLQKALWEKYAESFTPTGKSKAGGELNRLEDELRKIEADKKQVLQQRSELEALQRQFAELAPRLESLQNELKGREQEANELRAQASAAELQLAKLRQCESELDTAKDKLHAVSRDLDQLNKLTGKLEEAKSEFAGATDALNDALNKEQAARQHLAEAERKVDAVSDQVKTLSERRERTNNLLKLHESERRKTELTKLVQKAARQSENLHKLRMELEKVPKVTAAKLKKLQDLSANIRDLEIKLEAIGLTIELQPETAARLTVTRAGVSEELKLSAGVTETVHAPQSLELLLRGWGRLHIRSGATELSTLETELEKKRKSLREQLSAVECPSLREAEVAVARGSTLQKEIKTADDRLVDVLEDFDSLTELQSELASLERQAKALRDTLAPNAEEIGMSSAALEANAEQLNVAWNKAQEAQTAATQELKKQRRISEDLGEKRAQAERDKTKHAGAMSALEQQISDLRMRYPQGMDQAKSEAQSAFVSAEARRDQAKKALPPDADKLPERNKRAAAAYEQVRQELEERESELHKLEGALQTRGAEGLYSKLVSLEERETILRQQIERLRSEGWAARLAHDLIQFREQKATQAVLGPLEARLSGNFAEISHDYERRVYLDEQLQIAGIGTDRKQVIAFANLSQGAKEQLLLCLRLAVASEVSADGHKLVVLDDVLVNTDEQRQQRVLDLLQTAAEQLQILILTCHPERYRGVGAIVEIQSE
ncbi:MAG: chromosome segregation protein [Verrucomicrobia bacterium ADurb.Bin118]|nr:MAG: chromosome segregation protein [Verrucomicrobia bacterium ADurb.Bin118]